MKFSFIKYWLMRVCMYVCDWVCVCVSSILLLHSSLPAHTIHYFGWEKKKDFRFMFEKRNVSCIPLQYFAFHFSPHLCYTIFRSVFFPVHILFTNESKEFERERERALFMKSLKFQRVRNFKIMHFFFEVGLRVFV